MLAQNAIIVALALAALFSLNAKGAMFVVFNYWCTFVGTFLVLSYLFEHQGRCGGIWACSAPAELNSAAPPLQADRLAHRCGGAARHGVRASTRRQPSASHTDAAA
jgi:hypothetical protein